jgi:hypothetical protein
MPPFSYIRSAQICILSFVNLILEKACLVLKLASILKLEADAYLLST